jgi:hypothetical protein
MLELKTQPYLHCTRGDFGIQVKGNFLFMPDEVAVLSKKLHARTGEEFVTVVNTFPSGVAAEFGWSGEEVATAVARLKTQLQGIMDPRLLNPAPAPYYYGAFPVQTP